VRLKSMMALAFLLIATSGMAFDGGEHRHLSNIALRIALARAHCLPTEVRSDIEKLITDEAVERNQSFGDLVAFADYVKDASPIFDAPDHHYPGPSAHAKIDWQHLEELRSERLRFLQAATINENHFQTLARVTHLLNHSAAIAEARDHHWMRSLLLEAYALHFIEDSFAPGHIATARGGIADFVAMGIHDKYNARGLQFRFDANAELLSIARFVSESKTDFEPKQATADEPRLDIAAFDQLEQAMTDGQTVTFVGDSRLRMQPVQAAFIAAVAALSLSEVLCTHANVAFAKVSECAAGDIECATDHAADPKRLAKPLGGAYTQKVGPVQAFLPGEILFLTLQSAANPARRGNSFEGFVGTRSFAVETMLLAASSSGYTRRSFAPSLFLGYARGFGPGAGASAWTTRVIVPIPRTNLQLSGAQVLGRSRYRYSPGYAFSFEAGFGLVFARLGVERSRNTTPLGRSTSSQMYTFGITAVVPGRTALGFASRKLRR
jgi:hypothetical protein